ncbi:MAG: hypothetical protein ACKO70_06480, partial [Actinomycetota bacterium]
AGVGDAWTLTVPAGSGTVPVTVRFNGGLTASAGSFTYGTAPAAGPLPPAGFTVKAKPGREVVLKWTASPSDGVTSYVLGTQKNAGAWRDRNVGDVLRRTYTVKLNKTFCYRVAAVAAGIQGDWTPERCVQARP